MKFTIRPLEVDAVLFDGLNTEEVQAMAGQGNFQYVEPFNRDMGPDLIARVFNQHDSTWVWVKENQWIVKDSHGLLSAYDTTLFAEKYEQVV